MLREALTTRAQTASEEKGRAVEALARQVLERWKTTKMKKGEEEKDANEIVLGVLETLKEERAEAHRVGKLVKKKEKKETTDAETQKETTIDDGNEKVPLAATMNFGTIIAQEMAAKEALWKPKDEDGGEGGLGRTFSRRVFRVLERGRDVACVGNGAYGRRSCRGDSHDDDDHDSGGGGGAHTDSIVDRRTLRGDCVGTFAADDTAGRAQ